MVSAIVDCPPHNGPAVSQKTEYCYKTQQRERPQKDTLFLVPTLPFFLKKLTREYKVNLFLRLYNRNRAKRTCGELEIQLRAFLASMEVTGQLHDPAALRPGENSPRHQLNRLLGGP
jgi:hypothetical protein